MSNSSTWSIDRTLLSATTKGQSEPGNDGNEGILKRPRQIVMCHIQDTCWGESYPSAEIPSVYSAAPVQLAILWGFHEKLESRISRRWINSWKKKWKRVENLDTNKNNIQPGYKNGNWHWKMFHIDKKNGKKIKKKPRRNRTTGQSPL